jgi:hypothetical protein
MHLVLSYGEGLIIESTHKALNSHLSRPRIIGIVIAILAITSILIAGISWSCVRSKRKRDAQIMERRESAMSEALVKHIMMSKSNSESSIIVMPSEVTRAYSPRPNSNRSVSTIHVDYYPQTMRQEELQDTVTQPPAAFSPHYHSTFF